MQEINEAVRPIVASPVGAPVDAREWLVLMTEPNREMTAQANLVLRKIPFYLPTIYRAGRISARRQAAGAEHPDVVVPLFPGILFVPADRDFDRNYQALCLTPGMRSHPLMRFGEHEAYLRPIAMEAVRRIEASERDAYLRAKGRKTGYLPKVGDEVSVLVDEVLGGMKGRVDAVDERGRITLLTELMRRTVRVKLNANQIEPVQADPAEATDRR
ncbi:transcription termination/antitermination protein NusG [Bradyrhizobium sp. SRS-191]|uniref:transcription termination/antitermination protein NusG n=1 Tax=Bradyrhizobium sp. SRS-191 TaxID=2962606 RepID=UPI00211E8386|nr:transcription termination/antitermination NusG family protein [Bradyrhizobium sp. SRS-191]